MADPNPNPAPSPKPAAKTQPHGYFNQAQVADIQTAEELLPIARNASRSAALATRDITPEYLNGLADAIALARAKMAATGQANDGSQPPTLNAGNAERALLTTLQGIQSAAKQRERMESEDDDPTTNFKAEGYLIGERLNKNRGLLLQNAATLLGKAKTESLPGYKTPAAIAAIEQSIQAYKDATASEAESETEAEQDRIARDKLVQKINARRLAIQHAADALWPYISPAAGPDNGPVRKLFKLPPDRPMNV